MRHPSALIGLFLCLLFVPVLAFSQENGLEEFSKALERKFLGEKATIEDAEMVVHDLLSSKDEEFSRGLYFAPFVTPRFPSMKATIEEKVVRVLNNGKGNRFFQGAETALAIHFSKENAGTVTFVPGEPEVNLVKALIQGRAGLMAGGSFERILTEFEPGSGPAITPSVDGESLKEALEHCTLFREIIEITFAMKYYSLSFAFARIVSQHPREFDKASIAYANGMLEELRKHGFSRAKN